MLSCFRCERSVLVLNCSGDSLKLFVSDFRRSSIAAAIVATACSFFADRNQCSKGFVSCHLVILQKCWNQYPLSLSRPSPRLPVSPQFHAAAVRSTTPEPKDCKPSHLAPIANSSSAYCRSPRPVPSLRNHQSLTTSTSDRSWRQLVVPRNKVRFR